MSAADYFWILFILIILIIVALIIVAVLSIGTANAVQTNGSPWTLQTNASTPSTMVTGSHNWLINQAANANLTIASNPNNTRGREIRITNSANSALTLDTSQLLSYVDGTLSGGKVVGAGSTAIFVFTDSNRLLRTT